VIAVVARHQLESLRRQRILLATILSLLAMTALAGVIGWSSHNTIVRVYNDATQLLAADGKPAPPNPFALKPTLSLLSNMSIYIPLIGALLAVVIGHVAMVEDKANGTGRLVFSRPLSRRDYLAGKATAVAMVLAATMVASAVIATVALVIVNRATPSIGDVGRLASFYAVSWLYVLLFALVGMVTVLLTTKRSLALLGAMGVWLVLTFAVPQFTSGLHPTASLNPIVDPVSTSQTFFRVTANLRPLSVAEQYRAASAHILELASAEPAGTTALRVLPIVGALGLLAVAATRLVNRHDYSNGSSDD
jgi:ABC-type transport system involved in multi-copper enzyme maturation permease subunit